MPRSPERFSKPPSHDRTQVHPAFHRRPYGVAGANRTGVAAVTLHETLKAMRELIKDEKNWCQGTGAKDARELPVDATSPDAVRWCIMGACIKVSGEYHLEMAKFFDSCRAGFNDTHTHAEVIARLDDAIEATRS